MGPALAAAIPAVVSAVSGIVSTWMRNRQEKKAYAEMQRYNSPKSQMGRYADAGLSPYLIYGQGTSGNVTAPGPSTDYGLGDAVQGGINEYQNIRDRNLSFDVAKTNAKIIGYNLQKAGWDVSKAMSEASMAQTENQRKTAEFFADFPQYMKQMDQVVDPDMVSSSYRMKMNELKRSASEAAIDRAKVFIDNMRSKNVVEAVKAKYAQDFGMVGGDWTQGLGLLKSLGSTGRSLFRSTRKVDPESKAVMDAYRKFKGQQHTRSANRFLFEQLNP